jgi:tRNA uridine 5-carboxymethylaminomethyl modification enzyme
VEQFDETLAGWQPGSDQVSCRITYTTQETADIVMRNLHLSAMYGGEIEGTGPRYCPSIEDKFVRFEGRPRHMLFIEPEGRNTNEYYINGLSTSLPFDTQLEMIASIPGLEKAHLLRPAYAVEYDFAPPTQIYPNLESKKVENLFFAGQINGTSGYEEAACQGLMAGVNAVLKVRGDKPFILKRYDGYTGVLIDDLVTKGTQEPYRMFTSRAEYRLLFNHGSSELRMLEYAKSFGLLSESRIAKIEEKKRAVEEAVKWMESNRQGEQTWATLVRRNEADRVLPESISELPESVLTEALYRVRYDGYLKREMKQVEKLNNVESILVPRDFDFLTVRGLKKECALKLNELKPSNLGQASRVSGVNPADISILMVALSKR